MAENKLDGLLVDDAYHLVEKIRNFFILMHRMTANDTTDGCELILNDILRKLSPEYAQDMQKIIDDFHENFNLPELSRHAETE